MALSVAYQGVAGAYSEAAARKLFGRNVALRPLPEFADVFAAVARGRAARAVVPIENSVAGPVTVALDLLLSQPVTIVGETYLRISHCLLAPRGVRLADVREVWSHPQALAQCAASLAALPGVVVSPHYDTAGSAELVAGSDRRDLAAIASAGAGRLYGLKVLRRGFEDDPTNTTRFVVLTRRSSRATPPGGGRGPGRLKVSLTLTLPKERHALYRCLEVLARHDFDVVRLVPRPSGKETWQSIYFLDLAPGPKRPSNAAGLGQALAELRDVTATLQFLGAYQRS